MATAYNCSSCGKDIDKKGRGHMVGCPMAGAGLKPGKDKTKKQNWCTYEWRRKPGENVFHVWHACGKRVDEHGIHAGPHTCAMCRKTP